MGQHTATEEQKGLHGNLLRYTAWVTKAEAFSSRNGGVILKLNLAEKHREKNGRAPKEFKDPNKSDDDYVDTYVSWHKLSILGEIAEELAQDPEIQKGALLLVETSYREGKPFVMKNGVETAGREETIGDTRGYVAVKYPPKTELPALWDGLEELPQLAGSGGGSGAGPVMPEFNENEGF
jgi:hypothetical protein